MTNAVGDAVGDSVATIDKVINEVAEWRGWQYAKFAASWAINLLIKWPSQ